MYLWRNVKRLSRRLVKRYLKVEPVIWMMSLDTRRLYPWKWSDQNPWWRWWINTKSCNGITGLGKARRKEGGEIWRSFNAHASCYEPAGYNILTFSSLMKLYYGITKNSTKQQSWKICPPTNLNWPIDEKKLGNAVKWNKWQDICWVEHPPRRDQHLDIISIGRYCMYIFPSYYHLVV